MDELVLEVGNCVTSIVSGSLNKETYQEFRRALGYRPDDYQFMIRQYAEKVRQQCRKKGYSDRKINEAVQRAREWDGYKSDVRYNRGHCGFYKKRPYTHFSTGLISTARQFFKKYNIPHKCIDIRGEPPSRELNLCMSNAFEERDYQREAKDKAIKQTRGIIKASTGSGKTGIACEIIAELGIRPFVFYVTSTDLLEQAYNEIHNFVLKDGEPLQVGRIGGGHKDIQDINVMTIQTAVRSLGEAYEKYDEESKDDDKTDYSDIRDEICKLIYNAKGIIFDECQHVSSRTAQIVSDRSENAYYRYGMSATPKRDQGDDILIDACFGKTICNISSSYLIDKGYLIKPEIWFLNVNNMKDCPYSSYQKIYKHALKENTLRNEWIANIAENMLAEGRLPLVLVKHKDHGRLLESMMPNSKFIHGGTSNKKREEHLDKMRRCESGITIATSILDEGVDVKPLDTLILSGSGKSHTRALQRIGRILRPWPSIDNNIKNNVVAIDFMDNVKYLKNHSKARLKMYRHEPEFDIKFLDTEEDGENS